ncbi:hypothetical protein [Nannocystis sp. SCPEA4]|uniref:hypothetical protein n=1 Tax=Nannocystis sp. SCPEA4 TaxID=2996787 RepID=UPI00226DAEC6|nr:hypothetical protein [Nannocystis sp. SCPEA4]MCY1058663.1 hypothetical protein [Nannocystis sp. SCPEA4]
MRHALLALLCTAACGRADDTASRAAPTASVGPAIPATPDTEVPPPATNDATAPSAANADTTSPRDFAEYTALATPLRCDRVVRCGEIGASEREQCLHEVPRALVLLGVARGVQAGRYRFDPALANQCLQLLRDAPCDVDHDAILPDCLGGAVPAGLRPAVAPGGACERWEECEDGICTGELGCPGVCRARTLVAGGPCDQDTLCSDDLFCDGDVCRPRGDLGSACTGHWQACRRGLVCQGYIPANRNPHAYRREQPGVCEAPRRVGQPCRPVSLADDCAPGTFCDFGAAAPTCRARLPREAACTWLDACADGLRCDGLLLGDQPAANGSGMRTLVEPGVCRPVGDRGSRCDPAAAATLCPMAMTCTEAGACVPRGDTGADCREHNDCRAYHFCDPATGTCRPQPAVGEPCAATGPGDHCAFGRCDPKTRRCVGACRRDN